MHHVGVVRRASYCARQLHYDRRHGSDDSPPAWVAAVRETAYRYPEFVDVPRETLDDLAESHGVAHGVLVERFDVEKATRSLSEIRDRDGEVWRKVTDPDREERYLQGDGLHGTVDKTNYGDGATPSLVKTGRPPDEGVWPSHRVEAEALRRLLEVEGSTSGEALVEYPVVGAVRRIRLGDRDGVHLERAIERADVVEKGGKPRRTRHRGRCRSCEHSERCGVDNPVVALLQLGGLPSPGEGKFGRRLSERFTGLFD